tara:strand:- start:1123 stop:1671 length:549 start_codon:yes stop_codon:yes gene_type:complete
MTEIKLDDKIFKMFINQGDIENKIDEIATKINNDFKNKCPVILCVLKGSYMFFSDLTKKLNIDCTVSFIQIKSYENTSSTGKIKEVMGLNDSINSKDVIIIEDIIDTGTTYNFLINYLQKFKPSSLKIATLFYKSEIYLKKFKNPPDYYAFDIPDKFIVGYGLDYNQLGRNYNKIYELIEGQ